MLVPFFCNLSQCLTKDDIFDDAINIIHSLVGQSYMDLSVLTLLAQLSDAQWSEEDYNKLKKTRIIEALIALLKNEDFASLALHAIGNILHGPLFIIDQFIILKGMETLSEMYQSSI